MGKDISTAYGAADGREPITTLHWLLALGIIFSTPQSGIAPYKNEAMLWHVFKGRRDQVALANKFCFKIKNGVTISIISNLSQIRQAVESSLHRLDTDHIGLLYQHRVNTSVPVEDVVGVMADLVQEGKVRYLDLSEADDIINIRKAHTVHPRSPHCRANTRCGSANLEGDILPALPCVNQTLAWCRSVH